MSQGEPVPWADAAAVARVVVAELGPVCTRIRAAGSLRRRKEFVSDIEIVAEAQFETRPDGLFGSVEVDLLEERIAAAMRDGLLEARQVVNHRRGGELDTQTKLGPSFKALVAGGIPLDLFIVRPPATWGVIFGLRTGPGAWNIRLVDECKAIGRRVTGGQVERYDGSIGRWVAVPTPEEEDFYAAIGQPFVPPALRAPELVAISRELATP